MVYWNRRGTMICVNALSGAKHYEEFKVEKYSWDSWN